MSKLKIQLDDEVYRKIMAFTSFTTEEFSGVGFCEVDIVANTIFVYDFIPLNIGDWATTEIPHEKMLPLMAREDKANMKVWLHRHPMGTGIPGPHNWSGTDNNNIYNTPMGSTPENLDFMVSIVMTPKGLVGRIDKYRDGKVITKHLEVFPTSETYRAEFQALLDERPKKPIYRFPDGVAQELGLPFTDDEIYEGDTWGEDGYDDIPYGELEDILSQFEEEEQEREERRRFSLFNWRRNGD